LKTARGKGRLKSLLVEVRIFASLLSIIFIGGVSAEAADASFSGRATAALGQQVFFDATLSLNGDAACSNCHRPTSGFADIQPVSAGTGGRRGARNAPSLQALPTQVFFWDGRSGALEDAVLRAFSDPVELGLPDLAALLERLKAQRRYAPAFSRAFGDSAITTPRVAAALSAYLRTLAAGRTAFDRFVAGDTQALTAAAQRGRQLFEGRAQCASCHQMSASPAMFTDREFHPSAVAPETAANFPARVAAVLSRPATEAYGGPLPEDAELGRFLVTRQPRDIGAFRTPSLRNVAITAPYMHDGSVPTLPEAIDREIYYRTLQTGKPNTLTAEERADLLAFLQALTIELPASAAPRKK